MTSPSYFDIKRKDGSQTVPLSELIQTDAWLNIISAATRGTVYVDLHDDELKNVVKDSKTLAYNTKSEFKSILKKYSSRIVLRYGVSYIDGLVIIDLDLL